eukprot:scaffold45874_cov31-Prasinocladus_malaysianus.AAC.1
MIWQMHVTESLANQTRPRLCMRGIEARDSCSDLWNVASIVRRICHVSSINAGLPLEQQRGIGYLVDRAS